MASTKRIFSRPRTRVYDSNYNIGEAYYKSALDSLDKRSSYSSRSANEFSSAVQETIEPPPAPRQQRPVSVPDWESVAAKGKLEEDLDEEMLATLRRIRSARQAAAAGPSAEENFESAFNSRRDEVKKRFSEKMLDSVGILEVSDADAAAIRKRRMAREEAGLSSGVLQHWTALDAGVEDASARALRSRARLNDLTSEMEELAERGAARERRAADLRALVTSEANNSMRFSSKKITTTTTTTTY